MRIFICDDEKNHLAAIASIIRNYILFKKESISLEGKFTDPNLLLKEFAANKEDDNLFFLDVDLKSTMDGIILAEKIKQIDSNAKIVFITTHGELSSLVFKYQIEAMDYIEKDHIDHIERRIKLCIDTAWNRFLGKEEYPENFVIIKMADRIEKIPLKKIMFFESSSKSHRIIAHLDNHQFDFYGKLSELTQKSKSFMRSHNSFVVNLQNISLLDKKKHEIHFINGESCFTSIRYQKNIAYYLESHH